MKTHTGKGSRSTHDFREIASAEIPRSTFDRSSKHKTTLRGSFLTPIFWDEILPGDTINLKQSSFFRLATPSTPIMDEIIMETQYFFVPLRIIWDLYPRFMGEQPNADDSIEFDTPTVDCEGGANRFLYIASYMGVPLSGIDVTVSALPFRAYNKIFNDWYRDPNLQDKAIENTGDNGTDTESDFPNRRRGKRKDLISGSLPWPQRGDAITLLFDGLAPVTAIGDKIPTFEDQSGNIRNMEGGGTATNFWSGNMDNNEAIQWTDTKLQADLSTASANTINGIRNAFAVQRLLERDARGGARLTEILRSHFKVVSPDARLQRPEYIGGTRTIMGMTTAISSNQNASIDFGQVTGVGVGHGVSNSMMYSATEHGILMGINSITVPLTYQQSLAKKFSRVTRYDYFWPAFSHIGEQPILNKEVYCVGTDDLLQDAAVFGYNEAWSQYRMAQDLVTGNLNSDSATPLDVWHLALDFTSLPVLGDSFIQDSAAENIDRALIVQTTSQFIAEFHFNLKHTRPIPTFSTPGLIDHF